MDFRKHGIASAALALIAAVSLVLYCYFTYQVGCTADLKTGSVGDPRKALSIAGTAFLFYAAGLVSGTASIGMLPRIDREIRVGCSAAFFLAGGVALWFAGFFLETAGVQACFAP